MTRPRRPVKASAVPRILTLQSDRKLKDAEKADLPGLRGDGVGRAALRDVTLSASPGFPLAAVKPPRSTWSFK